MAEVAPGVRRSMQGNRSRDTKPELLLRSLLHARGLRYRVNHRLLGTRHTADVVFTRARVAVFVDGCWWHKCPEHYKEPKSNTKYWLPKVDRNVARDAKVDALLDDAGWTVVRVWEHEDPVAVADRVERLVRERRS
ncbi:very short patch repair endonuclease [Nocardioides sp. BGMRC 2183]|nr:very short patch repair endonuclease [Nocardioides sp. BGMRC 2183]